MIASRDETIAQSRQQISELDEVIGEYQQELDNTKAALGDKELERRQQMLELQAELAAAVENWNNLALEHQETIKLLDESRQQLADKEAAIAQSRHQLAERDWQLSSSLESLAALDRQIVELDGELDKTGRQLKVKSELLTQLNADRMKLHQQLKDKNWQLAAALEQLAALDRQIIEGEGYRVRSITPDPIAEPVPVPEEKKPARVKRTKTRSQLAAHLGVTVQAIGKMLPETLAKRGWELIPGSRPTAYQEI